MKYKELLYALEHLTIGELEQEVLVDAEDSQHGRSIFNGMTGLDRMTEEDELANPGNFNWKKGQVFLT